jgi:nucleotide-binding universal stress UspA family protein
MEIKKILFVTEFEELWFDALQSLMDLRKAGLNHVVFLHVIERDKVAMHRGTGYLKSEEMKLKEIANVRFIEWAESLFEEGMECGAYIVVGNIVPRILNISQEEKVSLIVTGRHKKPKLKSLYADSSTIELLRKTPVPVLVHKYITSSGKVNEKPFDRPMLATDWSNPCERAVEFLIAIKNTIKKAAVVHVISEKGIKGLSKMDIQKLHRENRNKLDELCDTLADEGIDARPHLHIGDTFEQIERAATEHEATMVIAGTTGKGTWESRWLGSVSQRLAESSELPTLLVPSEDDDRK